MCILFLPGKMIETVEAHQRTKLIFSIEDQLNALASPFLKKLAILDDTTLMATFIKEKIELNRPVAIGVSILELSKRLMYSFLYDVLYPFYGGPQFVQPMYMDTGGLILWLKFICVYVNILDSFVLRAYTENLDDDIRRLIKVMDTCEYCQHWICVGDIFFSSKLSERPSSPLDNQCKGTVLF